MDALSLLISGLLIGQPTAKAETVANLHQVPVSSYQIHNAEQIINSVYLYSELNNVEVIKPVVGWQDDVLTLEFMNGNNYVELEISNDGTYYYDGYSSDMGTQSGYYYVSDIGNDNVLYRLVSKGL